MDVTPLMKMVRHGNLEEARKLLRNGADPTKLSPFGIDLLALACASGNIDTVHFIYHALKSVSIAGSADLSSAVRTAVLFGHESVVDFLIKQKCDLDDKDKDSGVTALMLAACNGSSQMVSLLLCHGVDPYVRNVLNQTALDIAAARKCGDVISLLQSYMKRENTAVIYGEPQGDTRRQMYDVSDSEVLSPVLQFKIPQIIHTKEPNLIPPQSLVIHDVVLCVPKISTPTSAGPETYNILFSCPISPIKRDLMQFPIKGSSYGHRLSPSPLKLHNNSLSPPSQMTPQGRCSPGSLKRLKIDNTNVNLKRLEIENSDLWNSNSIYRSKDTSSEGFYSMSSHSLEFGSQSCPFQKSFRSRSGSSPRYRTCTSCTCCDKNMHDPAGQSGKNPTFEEKIDLLDKLVSETARKHLTARDKLKDDRNSKPLWRSLSNRLQVRKRRSGYTLSTVSSTSFKERSDCLKKHQEHPKKSLPDPLGIHASASDPGFCIRKGGVELSSYLKERIEENDVATKGAGGYDGVSDVLRTNELGQYVPLFKQHEIDLPILATLTDEDLTEMGVLDLRHRRTILQIAGLMRNWTKT